jgi:hypothetical protein
MKNLSLSIPTPCSEKWENFTITSHGGFCSSCSKTVVDFTSMSDDQVLDFFTKHSAHACGRFRPDQLKAYSATAPLKINPGLTLLKAGFLSMLFMLAGKQTFAQEAIPKTKKEVVDRRKHAADEKTDENTPQTLKGIVLTEDNEPLPGATIMLKGSETGTTAGADGRFEFPRKVKEGDILVISFIGFNSMEHVVTKNTNDLEIPLRCDYAVLGEVAIDRVYTEDPSGFRKMWKKVKGVF